LHLRHVPRDRDLRLVLLDRLEPLLVELGAPIAAVFDFLAADEPDVLVGVRCKHGLFHGLNDGGWNGVGEEDPCSPRVRIVTADGQIGVNVFPVQLDQL